jgi:hypothetical protein
MAAARVSANFNKFGLANRLLFHWCVQDHWNSSLKVGDSWQIKTLAKMRYLLKYVCL